MKHFFSSLPSRLRQGLAVASLGLFFSVAFHLADHSRAGSPIGLLSLGESEAEGEADGDQVYFDRPDLAMQQEFDLTHDPATGTVPRERLLAALRFNEAKLKDQAQQRTAGSVLASAAWVERGPSNVAGRILSLVLDPNDATGNTLWAGASGGGLWKATNATSANVQWRNVNSFFSNLAVGAVAVVPGTNPAVIYAGTGEGFFNSDAIRGAGIWKSSDGGATWAQLAATASSVDFQRITKIVVHPVTKDVYAVTRDGGLYRSQNGGTSWSQLLNTLNQYAQANGTADIEIGADNTIFVTSGLFDTDGIYRSTTGNAGSWTKLNTLPNSGLPTTGYQRIEVACAPSDANRVYALFQSASTYGIFDIYRSMDKGTTWTVMPKPGGAAFDFTRGQGWYDLAAGVSPTNPDVLYVGGIDVWLSTDAGAVTPTWSQRSDWTAAETAANYVHSDQHAILFIPSASGPSNQAYFGSDGGVAFSANASSTASTFSSRNNGLNVTQYYSLAMHPTNYNYFLAGAQDNGTQQYTAPGLNATTRASGGDGGLCAIDQDNPTLQISSYVYNQYYRSTDGGASFSNLISISSTIGSFINPWDYDSRANVLYARHNSNLYMAWTNVSTTDPPITITPSLGTGAGTITHVTVSPLTANRVYFGMVGGKVARVDNANTTTPTVKILFALASNRGSVSCVAVDPANEQHLLVTYSNYGYVSVFETTNADAATPTWTSVEGDLPDMPVRWALFDPRNTTRAILATEMGVYATNLLAGAATTWSPLPNLTNTRIDMLRYRAADQLVAAATHGRGLFTSRIFSTDPLPVTLASFTGARTAEGVGLRWQTASERNAQRFEVERSGNAVDYARLGSVAAAGNSTSPRAYAYTDKTAGAGTLYYRLRQVDFDGTVNYSPVVAVQGKSSTGGPALLASAYPNPFRTRLTLELGQAPAGEVSVSLLDAQGRRVYATAQRAEGRTLALALPGTLAPGSYLLTVTADGQKSTRRVVRE
ncbi:MAG: T9SS type A sorting domain-containing protein [Bacteroidota bacterium]|nr:T9SS type A sorting domain-containing protein [Bacteroidota bacterium]